MSQPDPTLRPGDAALAIPAVLAEAEAYSTQVIAEAIAQNGLEAAQYQIAVKQVEALSDVAKGEGKQTVLLPAAALEAFSDAFYMLRGMGK